MQKKFILNKEIICLTTSLNVINTLFSGQNFSWKNTNINGNSFIGFLNKIPLMISQNTDNKITIISTNNKINGIPLVEFIRNYFSLDVNNNNLFDESFKENYQDIYCLSKPYFSTRIMRQDPYETMVTFMCAQGIGMHLIRRQITMITARYGEPFTLEINGDSRVFHTFPEPSALAKADRDELAICTNNNRIRAANIVRMSKAVEAGDLDFTYMKSGSCSLETVRKTLCALPGIGMKIADCIALFGLGRFDAFPIDTHVKQYLSVWFGIAEARQSLTERNYLFLQDAARRILGTSHTGYAGHILFHCWRKEIKHLKTF